MGRIVSWRGWTVDCLPCIFDAALYVNGWLGIRYIVHSKCAICPFASPDLLIYRVCIIFSSPSLSPGSLVFKSRWHISLIYCHLDVFHHSAVLCWGSHWVSCVCCMFFRLLLVVFMSQELELETRLSHDMQVFFFQGWTFSLAESSLTAQIVMINNDLAFSDVMFASRI